MNIIFPTTRAIAYMTMPVVDMMCDCMKDKYDTNEVFRLFHGKVCDGNDRYWTEAYRIFNEVFERIKSGRIKFKFISDFDPLLLHKICQFIIMMV